MTDTEKKALQAREKREVQTPAEQTQPGLFFTPEVDIFETEKEIMLVADLPGVQGKDLTIDLNDNVLTLTGDAGTPESPEERDIYREYRTGKYYRQFTLSQALDQSRIEAEMKDGVLHLILPKVEKAQPRKISVKAG